MKILAVADTVEPMLFDGFDANRWREVGVDLILGCGDLPAEYLSFLAKAIDAPLMYVRGNHDGSYDDQPPAISLDIDGRLVRFGGLRILGMGGSAWYNGGPMQYTESEMAWRVRRRFPSIWLARGLDLVVAHSPPQFCPDPRSGGCAKAAGVGRPCGDPSLRSGQAPSGEDAHPQCLDADDRAHRGLACFRELILRYHPAFFLHGHRHQSFGQGKREIVVDQTRVVDTYGHYLLDLSTRHIARSP